MSDYQSWASELTYKPGFSFEVEDGCLRVLMETTCYYSPERTIRIASSRKLLAIRDRDHFSCIAYELIMEIEGHEAKEWFRRYGNPVFDPHPNGRVA